MFIVENANFTVSWVIFDPYDEGKKGDYVLCMLVAKNR